MARINAGEIVGVLFTIGGSVALLIAPLRDKRALVMSPGLEGCLTAGVVGLALGLAGGAGSLAMALLALPILAQIFRRRRVERVIRADSLASRGLSWYLGNQLGEVAEWLKAHAC